MPLYHRSIGWPATVDLLLQRNRGRHLPLTYGSHARLESMRDRYGVPTLPDAITFDPATVFEVECSARHLTKLALRIPLDTGRDLVLVLSPNGFVRTVWLNSASDTHATLNPERYASP